MKNDQKTERRKTDLGWLDQEIARDTAQLKWGMILAGVGAALLVSAANVLALYLR